MARPHIEPFVELNTDYRKFRVPGFVGSEYKVLSLDPDTPVADLSPGQQQMVEIAKGLSHDLKVLILDEPTASLTINESRHLFRIIRRLAAQGVSIVYVSHRMAEIFEISDRVTVMKDGRVFDYVSRTTPAPGGKDAGIIQQLFRNLGQKQIFGD